MPLYLDEYTFWPFRQMVEPEHGPRQHLNVMWYAIYSVMRDIFYKPPVAKPRCLREQLVNKMIIWIHPYFKFWNTLLRSIWGLKWNCNASWISMWYPNFIKIAPNNIHDNVFPNHQAQNHGSSLKIEGILPKWPYPPCLRMADRALLAGYPRNVWIEMLHPPNDRWITDGAPESPVFNVNMI